MVQRVPDEIAFKGLIFESVPLHEVQEEAGLSLQDRREAKR